MNWKHIIVFYILLLIVLTGCSSGKTGYNFKKVPLQYGIINETNYSQAFDRLYGELLINGCIAQDTLDKCSITIYNARGNTLEYGIYKVVG